MRQANVSPAVHVLILVRAYRTACGSDARPLRAKRVCIISAVWKLALKVVSSLVLSDTFDLTDLAVFQSVFGMIFTVIIALEFKRTLLVVSDRTKTSYESARLP